MIDVLLIDDEASFLESLAEGLRIYSSRLDVITAENGEKALKLLKTAMVDVVVTDLNMPGVNGYEFMEQLNKAHPGLPVIIMSAYAHASVEKRLEGLKFLQFIEKPLDLGHIAHAILTAARGSKDEIRQNESKRRNS